MPLDPESFRATFRAVPTSVAVVTTIDVLGVPHGITIGSLSALSLNPPLLSFCVARSTRFHAELRRAQRYCISVLAQGQDAIARRFADHAADRFADDLTNYDGMPAIAGALGWLICSPERLVDAGDHTIAIARIDNAVTQDGPPLLYWRRSYRSLQAAYDVVTA